MLNRGYLLVDSHTLKIINIIIAELNEAQDLVEKNRESSESIAKELNKIKEYFAMLKITDYDHVFSRVITELKKVYNSILKSYKLKAPASFLVELKEDQFYKHHEADYFERLTLVDAYHRLNKAISLGSHATTDEKSVSVFEEITDFHRTCSNASPTALAGLDKLKKSENDLGAGMSLNKTLDLVWKAIKKFPAADAQDAKLELSSMLSNLSTFTSLHPSDVFANLMKCVGDVYIGAQKVRDISDVSKIVKNHFHVMLKKEVECLTVSEQVSVLASLAKQDVKHEVLGYSGFKKSFSEKAQQLLFNELAAYDLIPGVNLQALINVELKTYFESHEPHSQLRELFIDQLKSVERDSNDRLLLLRACLDTEAKSAYEARDVALLRLKNAAKDTKGNKNGEIDDLCYRYQVLQQTDVTLGEAGKIIATRQQPELITTLKTFEKPIQKMNYSLSKFYKELHLVKRPSAKGNVDAPKPIDHGIKVIKEQLNFVTEKLKKFAEKESNMFTAYPYSREYKTICDAAGVDVLRKVAAIFNEYTSGRWKFHFGPYGRSHVTEANEVAKKINSFMHDNANGEKLLAAQQYIRDVLNRLEVRSHLKIGGSFSKRAHYCLNMLEMARKNGANQLVELKMKK